MTSGTTITVATTQITAILRPWLGSGAPAEPPAVSITLATARPPGSLESWPRDSSSCSHHHQLAAHPADRLHRSAVTQVRLERARNEALPAIGALARSHEAEGDGGVRLIERAGSGAALVLRVVGN